MTGQSWSEAGLREAAPTTAPRTAAAPICPGCLLGEYARLLCLGTAPLGGCAWAIAAWRFPWGLLLVGVSVWIILHRVEVRIRPWLSAVLTAASVAAVLAAGWASQSAGGDAPRVFLPFSPAAYGAMLAVLLLSDLHRMLAHRQRSAPQNDP